MHQRTLVSLGVGRAVRTAQLPYVPWRFDARFAGKTAEEVIRKFKTDAFPKSKFPAELVGRKVEEISALAETLKLKRAIEAMRLLNGRNDLVAAVKPASRQRKK